MYRGHPICFWADLFSQLAITEKLLKALLSNPSKNFPSFILGLRLLHPLSMEELTPRLIGALVSVSTKIIALRLGQVLGQAIASVTVEIVEGRAKGWHRNTQLGGSDYHLAPSQLFGENGLFEVGIN